MADRNRVKADSKKSRRPGRAVSQDAPMLGDARLNVRAVRELRSGVGSYEIAAAVNDLLQRGWVLLGAGFVGAETREFLYVLGAADAALLGGEGASVSSTDYSKMEAFVQSLGTDVAEV